MVITQTITLSCPYCQSQNLKRNGHVKDGRQRYRCNDCSRQFRENPREWAYSQKERETIIKASQERSSLRGLERTFGVSRHSVANWIKKS
jgi:transposase-like protein